MSKRFARLASAFAAVGLLCGCVLPAFAAETAQPARVLQYETAQPVSAVEVQAEWADVVIQPGQTDTIRVESAADARGTFGYDCSVADGVLTITVEAVEPEEHREYIKIGPFRILNSYSSTFDNTVSITLPDKMYDSIRTETEWGDIRIRDIQSQTAVLASDWGDIILAGAQPQLLNLYNDWGDIVFDQAAVTKCEAATEWGDIRGDIAGSRSSYAISTAVSYGDSNLSAQLGDGVHALAFTTAYGHIEVDFTA